MQEVVTLEIKDKAIRDVFRRVYEKFNLGRAKRPHITIRGPYSKAVSKDTIRKLSKSLSKHILFRVTGVGTFDAQKDCVVYLKIDADHLRALWWKPDFPIKKYGFNPHVTVFRGNKGVATSVYEYLNQKLDDDWVIKDVELKTEPIGQRELEFDE